MMRPVRWVLMAGYVLATGTAAAAGAAEAMPNDFPQFIVPGHEQAMTTLRSLYWLHYQHYRSRGKPMPTAWDEWMTGSTLWPAVGSTGGMSELRRHWAEGLGSRVIDLAGGGDVLKETTAEFGGREKGIPVEFDGGKTVRFSR